MKARFDKQKLLAAIIPAAGISQTKNTLTSVDGLLFECPPNPKYGDYDTDRGDLCRISAFDLEKGLRTSAECVIEEKGMFVINTAKVLQIVRALPDGEITIDIDERGRVKLSGGQSSFEIMATPGEEFPTMPMFIGERIYSIPQRKVRSLISETVFAVAQNDQRAAFNGALFKIKDGEMTVIACDAPLEPIGYIGCAASPSRLTRPRVQNGSGSRSHIGYSQNSGVAAISSATSTCGIANRPRCGRNIPSQWAPNCLRRRFGPLSHNIDRPLKRLVSIAWSTDSWSREDKG